MHACMYGWMDDLFEVQNSCKHTVTYYTIFGKHTSSDCIFCKKKLIENKFKTYILEVNEVIYIIQQSHCTILAELAGSHIIPFFFLKNSMA
jgi:hypothetical protein